MSGVLPPLGPGTQRHARGDSDASTHSTLSRSGGGGGSVASSAGAPAAAAANQRSSTARHAGAASMGYSGGGSSTARSYSFPSNSGGGGASSSSSVFRRPHRSVRHSSWDEDEEKIAPERQERVRMRGRYSKAQMAAEFGMVFSSSELGSDRDRERDSMGFDAETADPVAGAHFHRAPAITLASMRPAGFDPAGAGLGMPGHGHSYGHGYGQQQQQQRYREREHDPYSGGGAGPTFATEDDAAPRSNMDIGSYAYGAPQGQGLGHGLSSGGSGHNASVAAATGKTIWQMWRRMKEERARAHQREMARDVPRTARAAPSAASASMTASGAGAAVAAAGSGGSAAPASSSSSSSGRRDSLSIDYAEAGRAIASQLQRAGVRVSHDHLDVIHNLAGLEKVWLRAEEGLDEGEFVSFLQEVLRLPPGELSILFQKMDANADGSLSWDEYLSYLLIEVGHHWQFRAARGTWWLRDVDAPAVSTAVHSAGGGGGGGGGGAGHGGGLLGGGGQGVQVGQILVIPGDASSSDSSSRHGYGGGYGAHGAHGHGSGGGSAGANSSQSRYVLACKDNTIQVWNGGEGDGALSFQCHLPAPWRGGGGRAGGQVTGAAGLGYGFGSAGVGSGVGMGGVGGGAHADEAGASAARHLSSQSNRIGTRRAGGARQKRCGGGGWKDDSSSHSSSWRGGGGGLGGGDSLGAVDESISRRAAAHAGLGLTRLGLGDGLGASSSGRMHARWDPEGAERGGNGAGGADPDGDGKDGSGPGAEGGGSTARSRASGAGGAQHTCIAFYPPSRQILVARMDKSVHMFQQTSRASFVQVDRTEVLDTPQCMAVHVPLSAPGSFQSGAASGANGDLLIVGDTSGRCSTYSLPVARDFGSGGAQDKSANITQGGGGAGAYSYASPGGVGVPAGPGSASGAASAAAILGLSTLGGGGLGGGGGGGGGGGMAGGGRPHSFQIHRTGESIRRISMIPTVGLLTAGMDARLCISDLESGKLVRELRGHKRGVYSFAHCESHRCIFSAGFDSRVLVFDPYLPTATGSLGASHTRILDVLVNERKNQVITVCADKKIKVFDIRTYQCIQQLADSQEYAPYDELSAVAFDHEAQQLVTAGNKVRLWPVAIAPGNKARRGGPAHSNLVVAICYSAVFEQIISAGVDESVHVWDIWTGQSVFEFRTSHSSPLTAACLDHRGKRLLTGAHDGSVLMWNFHNGARMHEFTSRKKELLALLYLPRTLQCVVGIGLERSVVRWPDPNAPKNTKWLVQSDHRAEVLSVAYHDSILVTGATDGEIIVWYRDSALVSKRFDIPKTPRTGKRPGVAKMLFIDFPGGLVLLLAGTDDGSLHLIKVASSETVFSLFEVCAEPIVGMAANRVLPTTAAAAAAAAADGDAGAGAVAGPAAGARTRLMVCDCQVDAKLFDLSGVRSDHIESLPLLKSWEPHPGGTTTDLIALDALGCFAASSDTGDITIWDADTGEGRGKFAQRKSWPVADPRTSSHRSGGVGGGADAAQRARHAEDASSSRSDSGEDEESEGSSSDSSDASSHDEAGGDTGSKGKPGLSRHTSVLSSDSSRSQSRRDGHRRGTHHNHSQRQGGGAAGADGQGQGSGGDAGGKRADEAGDARERSRGRRRRRRRGDRRRGAGGHSPPKKEPSYAETHPMYVPRDDCDRYLQEHAQQLHMESLIAARAAAAAARDKDKKGAHGGGGGGSGIGTTPAGSKLHLADMLNKLEADLRHQHAQEAKQHAASTAGGGGGGREYSHARDRDRDRERERERERERDRDRDRDHHASTHGSGYGSGHGMGVGDVGAALQGAHVYERFHVHHSTGTSQSNSGTGAGGVHLSHSSDPMTAGDSFLLGGGGGGGSAGSSHRSSRVRHLTVEEEPSGLADGSGNGGGGGGISFPAATGSQTARSAHRPSARRIDPPASARTSLPPANRTGAGATSDAPQTARARQQQRKF